MSETDLRKLVQLRLSPRTVLFRNNQGLATYKDKSTGKSYPVRYGVAPGGSDLIGWTSVIVTPDMVGQRVAVFTAIETKSQNGTKQADQEHFISRVCEEGGYAGFATSEEEAEGIIPCAVK